MKAFAADHAKFRKAGAEILGVSRDDTTTQHRFRIHCATPFPLLSDAGGKVAKAYGAAMPVVPAARRVTFLIDSRGVIRAVVAGMPDNAALLATLESWKDEEEAPPDAR